MTSDEIKQGIDMREMFKAYGIKVTRGGMCCCPFHKEKHPSMKVYKDSYYCFSCHENGDVFTFVQKMDSCDFPTAFMKLGGKYEHKEISDREKKVAEMKRNQQKSKNASDLKRQEEAMTMMAFNLDSIRAIIEKYPPMSDEWTFAQNILPIVQEQWEQKFIRKEDVSISDVLRTYRRIRQRFPSL